MILVAVAILICIFVGLWTYARWNFGTLEKMGIPVVEYTNPLLGSLPDIYKNAGGPQDVQWMRKYGQVFGIYEGRVPQVFICNPELAYQICAKDSDHFNDRRRFEFGDPIVNNFPDFLPGEKWKTVRSLYTSTFTSGKLRHFAFPIREATQDFVAELKEKIKEGNGICKKIAIDQAVHQMATDLVCRAFYSINLHKDPSLKDDIFKIVNEGVKLDFNPSNWLEKLKIDYTHAFPFLRKLFPHDIFQADAAHAFQKIVKKLMAERRKSGETKNDVLDNLIEWWDKLDTPEFKDVGVDEHTLSYQALVFLVAGQDQISTAVAGSIYHIAKDPELEKRIRQEVDTAFDVGGGIDHDKLSDLHIVQACIQESLRLYTIFHRGERVCTKDWRSDKFNLSIKKGTCCQIPVWALNRNGEYNPNPDEFVYERFLPENKDKLCPFGTNHAHGHGPRQCVGRPFVNKVMPVVLAYLVRHFKFIARPDSEVKPLPGGFFIQPHDQVLIDIMER